MGTFLEERLREQTGVPQVSVTAASRYGPVTVFDEELDLGWEVDELRERFTADVVSRVSAGDRVEVEILVSESAEIRMRLQEEFEAALREAGAAETRVRVICAYKQGFSWLADYVLPAVQGEERRPDHGAVPDRALPGRTSAGTGRTSAGSRRSSRSTGSWRGSWASMSMTPSS